MGRRATLTRSERAIWWVERFCIQPDGREVRLSASQRVAIHLLYDGGQPTAIDAALSAYLTLLHLCGLEAAAKQPPPVPLNADLFSVWTAASIELRRVLVRKGSNLSCPALMTSWTSAAA